MSVSFQSKALPKPPPPGSRRPSKGWSVQSARRFANVVSSLDVAALPDSCSWVTLTYRDRPATWQQSHQLLRAWLERMRRAGVFYYLGCTEWQLRQKERSEAAEKGRPDPGGCPHFHLLLWPAVNVDKIVSDWVEIAAKYRPLLSGQHAQNHLRSVDAVLRYLLKHGYRTAKVAQRDGANMPAGWESSGRVWFSSRRLPMAEPRSFKLDPGQARAFRESMARRAEFDLIREREWPALRRFRGRQLTKRDRREKSRILQTIRADAAALAERIRRRPFFQGLRRWEDNSRWFDVAIAAAMDCCIADPQDPRGQSLPPLAAGHSVGADRGSASERQGIQRKRHE